VQSIYEENIEMMLLASIVGRLKGEIGKMTRNQNPQNLEQGLNRALAVREAIGQEKMAETCYTTFEKYTKFSERGGNSRSDNKYCPERTPKRPNDRIRSAAPTPKILLEGIGTPKEGRNPKVTNAKDVGTIKPTNAEIQHFMFVYY
jgi:hypothetical protein